MYAVTAWMVLMNYVLLVGTQMNEENNLKQNQNPKPELLTEQNIRLRQQRQRKTRRNPDKRERKYLKSLHCLENIGIAKESGIPQKNIKKHIQRHQAVVDKYFEEQGSNPKQMSAERHTKYFKALKRRAWIKKLNCKQSPNTTLRPFREVITDPLCLAIVGESRGYQDAIRSEWPSIESDIMEIVKTYNLTNKNSHIPRYDTNEIHRGFRIIKCMDEFSKEFMYSCLNKISDKWKKLKLKLMPAAELPKSRKQNHSISEGSSTLSKRSFSEVITDPLCLALAGERQGYNVPIRFEWPSIESNLMKLVMDYNRTNENGPILCYDTSEIHRGFRVIKCMNEFSRQFLYGCFNKICGKWKDLNVKLIPADNLPQKMFDKSNNCGQLKAKPQPPVLSVPPAPSWPAKFESNIKLENINETFEFFEQSNVLKHTNKEGHAVIESKQKRENLESKQFITHSPHAQININSSNNSSNINPFADFGFKLSTNYDTTDERGVPYREYREMRSDLFKDPNFQQEYPQTSRSSNYDNRTSSKYLNFAKESKLAENLESNQKYFRGWQKFSDYYTNSSESNFSETYHNHQQTYSNANGNFHNFTTLLPGEVSYNKCSQVSSNITTNYESTYKDVTYFKNTSRNSNVLLPTSTQHYFSEQQSHNFLPSDDDETPPPPPSFKNFNDSEDVRKRSRETRIRTYWD